MSEEKTYLDKGGVKVTSNRVVIGGKTYATKHITSVEMGSQSPNSAIPIILGLVGILVFLCGVGGVFADSTGTNIAVGIILGGGMLALAFFAIKGQKTSYIVQMSSSLGEVEALKTTDEGRVMEVVTAIQQAITEG